MPDKKQTALVGGLPMPVDKSLDNRPIRQAQPKPPSMAPGTPAADFKPSAMTTMTSAPSSGSGLMQPQNNSGDRQSQGYEYNPSSGSLVQNQITDLLDPNSALMRKAIGQSQGFMAQRGLQSSSIANEAALSSMIDKALPIAQQDAGTYGQADQLGWQHGFQGNQNDLDRGNQRWLQENSQNWQSGENTLTRDQQKWLQENNQAWQSGENTLTREQQQWLQENSQNWQSGENSLGRDFQERMQDLQHQQNLGMLDAQGQQQLERMEREASLTQERDGLLQGFQERNLDQAFLRDLEMKQVDFQRQDEVFEKQLNAASAEQYRNAAAGAYNNYLAQLSMIMSNPEMNPDQQTNAANRLRAEFNAMRNDLQLVYGFSGGSGAGGGQEQDNTSGGGPGIGPEGPGSGGGLMSDGTPIQQTPIQQTPIQQTPVRRPIAPTPVIDPRDRQILSER